MDKNILRKNWQSFAIFPCRGNSKLPATKNGFKDAQFGQDAQSFIDYGYNVALACEKSNVVVIDVDYHDENSTAMEDLKQLEKELGEKLPQTLTQSTASGNGRHFIFSSKGIMIPRGKIGKYCDLKFRGYIMIAPSIINGKQYEIIDGVDENDNFILAELPQKWIDFINKNQKSSENKISTKELPKVVYKNINIEQMFENCNFLQYCRENADCLSEPEWFSMINILAHIKNSDELIHELSEPYHNYNYEETQAKINNARKFGHPQNCDFLSTNYPDICCNCPSATKRKVV